MRLLCVAVLVTTAMASVAQAQTTRERSSIALLGGFSFGASERWQTEKRAYSASWDVAGAGPVGLRTTIGRVENLFQDNVHSTNTLDVRFISIEGRWRPRHTESGSLAVLHAGVALYNLREVRVSYDIFSPPFTTTEARSGYQMGLTAGAGLEIPIARQRWFMVLDVTYHFPTGDEPVPSGSPSPSFAVGSLGVSWRY
jgi:hypothetical protein